MISYKTQGEGRVKKLSITWNVICSHKYFGLITVKVLDYQSFNQQSPTLVQMLTSVKVSAILHPPGIVAPGEATGKATWILLEITAPAVSSGGGIDWLAPDSSIVQTHTLFLNTVYKQLWEICNENTTYHMTKISAFIGRMYFKLLIL